MDPRIEKIYRAIRFTGLGNSLRTLRYSRYRDRLDRQYQRRHPQLAAEARSLATQIPGPLGAAQAIPGGARFRFAHAELEICFLAEDLVRLTWEPGEPPAPYALAKQEWPEVQVGLAETEDGWRLESSSLVLEVQANGGIVYQTGEGRVLRRELPPERRGDGEATWTHRAALRPEECICGLGEQTGPLNLRGSAHRMWNTDPGGAYGARVDPIYMPLPLYLGLHHQGSYLVFYENHFPATFTFDAAGAEQERPTEAGPVPPAGQPTLPTPAPALASARFEGGMLRSYFIPGPPARLLERYTELTGRASLPPLWSLGYHQCRWGYRTEQDIRQVAEGFRQHEMPVSAIHLDIDYMDGFRVFTIDPVKFPDMPGLAKDLAAQGIRLVTIIDPGIKQDPGYFLYREGLNNGRFSHLPGKRPLVGLVWPGWSVFPDFTHPETRQWWGQQYGRLLEAGIAGFWHDMNEPSSFAAWGDMTLPLAAQHHLEGQEGDHRKGHNVYGLQMNRAAWEALRRLRPDKRPWIISRSGWAGQQRYAWNWTGDTATSWESLRMTIPTVLGLGLSGQPFSGPDIGGFSGTPSAELYLRWFQLAAFLPFFRTHSAVGLPQREPWVFGEPYTRILREFLRLRVRLLPYLYSLAWEATQTGQPPVRPLFWEAPEDPDLWETDDAFLLGEALLVAPVLEEGASERSLRLPAGGWVDFWEPGEPVLGGESGRSGKRGRLPTTLERIPVLVRAGSILPLAGDGGEQEAAQPRLHLHVYPPVEGDPEPARPQRLYSDAGEGYGDSRIDTFSLERTEDGLRLRRESQGEYAFPYLGIAVHLHRADARRVVVDGVEAPVSGGVLETGLFEEIEWVL